MREFSPEHRARISSAMSGKPKSEEHRAKMSANMRGKYAGANHPGWRGDSVGYHALHAYLGRNHPKSGTCDECGSAGITHYALIHGRAYSRDRDDYRELCVQCHRSYDGTPRKTHCVRGHEFNEENTYHRKDRPGQRQCRACCRERRQERDKAQFSNPAPVRLAGDMGEIAA